MTRGKEIHLPLAVIEEKVKEGYNDYEIGKQLGVHPTVIRRRRRWLKLPANKRKYPEASPRTKARKYGFASLTEEEKKVVRDYREAREIKDRPTRLRAQRRYFAKWRRIEREYLGKRLCPKCGEFGYAFLRSEHNTRTGYVYRRIQIEHRRGKQYLSTCYCPVEEN